MKEKKQRTLIAGMIAVSKAWEQHDHKNRRDMLAAIRDVAGRQVHWRKEHTQQLQNALKAVSDAWTSRRDYLVRELKEYSKGKNNIPLTDLVETDFLGVFKGSFLERAHTMVLCHLMDLDVDPELSRTFMTSLLSAAKKGATNSYIKENISVLLDRIDVRYEIQPEVTIKSSNCKIKPDIQVVFSKDRILVIENKVNSPEHDDQTAAYVREQEQSRLKHESSDKKLRLKDCMACMGRKKYRPQCKGSTCVYLFLDRRGIKAQCPLYVSLNYVDIRKAIEDSVRSVWKSESRPSSFQKLLVEGYLGTLKSMERMGPPLQPWEAAHPERLCLTALEYLNSRRLRKSRMRYNHER